MAKSNTKGTTLSKVDVIPGTALLAIETVERLSPRVRDARASYSQSIDVLKYVKFYNVGSIFTKSAIMVGLGETRSEVEKALKDLRGADVDLVTIGQYMRPSKKHLSIKSWVEPKDFDYYAKLAQDLGFKGVVSKPLVRSSYRASEFYQQVTGVNLEGS